MKTGIKLLLIAISISSTLQNTEILSDILKAPLLSKTKLTEAIELEFTIKDTTGTTQSIQLKGDTNRPTLQLDLSNNQLLLPFKDFSQETTQMVVCQNDCKMSEKTSETTYKTSKCTGNIATGPMEFTIPKNVNKNDEIKRDFTLLTKTQSCDLTTGILGFGPGSDFFQFIKNNYEVSDEETLFIGFHTIPEENSKSTLKSGKLTLNKRISPIGCSSNFTYTYDKENPQDGLSEYTFQFDVEYKSKDKTTINNVPTSNSKAKIDQNIKGFFGLKNSQNFIDQVKKMLGDSNDVEKAPTLRLKMKCVNTLDFLRYMWLEIKPEDYIVKSDTGVEFLIDNLDEKSEQDLQFGLLFLKKYELFMRVLDDDGKKWVTAGFGDINYTVNKGFWITVAAIVGAALFLIMVVIAIIFRDKGGKGGEGEVEDDEEEGYAKV